MNALVERLDLLLMYGDMSVPMRQVLIQTLMQLGDPEARAKMAVHLISISPEYCVDDLLAGGHQRPGKGEHGKRALGLE